MLTDEDSNEIGRRLYDLESDPPAEGWKRIATDLHPSDDGQTGFLIRHWWKPLILLIPISVYLLLPQRRVTTNSATALTEARKGQSPTSDRNRVAQANIRENASGQSRATTDDVRVGLPDRQPEQDAFEAQVHDMETANPFTESTIQKNVAGNWSDNGPQSVDLQPVPPGRESESDPFEGGVRKMEKVNLSAHDATGKDVVNNDQDNASQFVEENKSGVYRNRHADNKSHQQNESEGSETSGASILHGVPDNARNTRDVRPFVARELTVTEVADTIVHDPFTPREAIAAVDSASTTDVAEKNRSGSWRVTASVIPQFTQQSIRPVANDEVFVTSINNSNSKYPERIGIGFAAGAGKAVHRNLYVDAQLTFTKTKQRIDYAYATGKVDTLLAALQSDGSVRVIPVYQETNSLTSASYSYGGLRITGTYYFWSTPVRRFSITAGAGANVLLSSSLRERINGTWIESPNTLANKTNYSFIVGAGYNVNIGKDFELMISPVLNYYLKKIESEQQPFNFNHRSYGLNVMISKMLY